MSETKYPPPWLPATFGFCVGVMLMLHSASYSEESNE